MIELTIPGHGIIQLEYVVLDVNGTLAIDGVLIEGVAERLAALRDRVQVRLLTADTHGRQSELDRQLGLTADRLQPGGRESEQKADYVLSLNAAQVAAIGNGANDAGMLQAAALGVAVLGREGLSVEALAAADVIAANILDALDLLLNPNRLVATLRR